jgi:hypothetical protein
MVVEKTALPSRVRPLSGALRAFIWFGSWLGIASLVALLLTEAGTRLGLTVFGAGSPLLFSAYTGAVAAVLAFVAGFWMLARYKRRPPLLLVVGLLGGLVAFWVPYSAKQKAPRANVGAAPATDTLPPAPSSGDGR